MHRSGYASFHPNVRSTGNLKKVARADYLWGTPRVVLVIPREVAIEVRAEGMPLGLTSLAIALGTRGRSL